MNRIALRGTLKDENKNKAGFCQSFKRVISFGYEELLNPGKMYNIYFVDEVPVINSVN